MKKLFKIATVSALVMLSANAMAEDATQDFTWTGTVPADVTGGIKIKDLSSGVALDAGIFNLTETANVDATKGLFDITSPSILSFDVVTDDVDENHVDYYYTLTNFIYNNGASGTNRSVTTLLPTVELMADGSQLVESVKTTTAATAQTDLTIAGNAEFIYGNEYMFQATLLITDQAI